MRRFVGRVGGALGRARRSLTKRQAVALATVGLLGLAVGAAGAFGRTSVAVALVGPLCVVVFVALLQFRRRTTQEIRALTALTTEVIRLTERLEVSHRRTIAAVETERLASADRHRALLAVHEEGRTSLLDSQSAVTNTVAELIKESDERAAAELQGEFKRATARLSKQQAKVQWDHTRAVHALAQIFAGVAPREATPPSMMAVSPNGFPNAAAPTKGSWIFVVPHPDDEVLGAGVGIAEAAAAGADAHVLLLTRGTTAVVLKQLNGEVPTNSWWGGMTHDPVTEGYRPLTETEFGAARYGEFVAALGALGVDSGRIHEAGLMSQAITTGDVKAAIMRLVETLGSEVGLWAPSYIVDNHEDHLAAGRAVRELSMEHAERFRECRYYILPAYWGDPRLREVNASWISPTDLTIGARVRNACRAYGAWQPNSGAFAIGYQSVPAMFAEIDVAPRTMLHS